LDVAIIMGSDSDWDVMKKAVELLKQFEINFEVTVASAHRTPHRVQSFVKSCDAKDVKVFIAAAGCAAHLAGVIASYTTKPVIGVPIASEPLKGWDSLLSTVQMPPGVPVATMAINGAKNAAIFAAQVISLSNADVKQKLDNYRKDMAAEVERKAEKINEELKALSSKL